MTCIQRVVITTAMLYLVRYVIRYTLYVIPDMRATLHSLLIIMLLQNGDGIFHSTNQVSHKRKQQNRSTLLEPRSLNVQLIIAVSSTVKVIPETVNNTRGCNQGRMSQTSDEGYRSEI